MTKQHFIALADAIRLHNQRASNHVSDAKPFTADQIDALAEFCDNSSGRFNRERWLAYIAGECGPNGGAR
jgi:plasmid maintenance system antidote protein VapI